VWLDDLVVVSEGRVVAGVSVVTPVSLRGYDVRLARAMAQDAEIVEHPAATVGPDAGYEQIDAVIHHVSATLVVPRISSTSPYATAYTDVSAQVLGSSASLPFIQAGISEDESHRHTTYSAYWSDNAHGLKFVPRFSVRPGDRVSVSLKHADRHWTITFVDGTTSRQIVTSQEGDATFKDALWTQQDPDAGSSYYVYPKIADVRISNLSVNGVAPAQWELQPDQMSMGRSGVKFTPTVLVGDAFTVVPARVAQVTQAQSPRAKTSTTATTVAALKAGARRCIEDWNKRAGAVAKYEVSVGLGIGRPLEVGSGASGRCEVVFVLRDGEAVPLRFGWIFHHGVWEQPTGIIADVQSLTSAHSIAAGEIAQGARPPLPSVPARLPAPPGQAHWYDNGGCPTVVVPGSRVRIEIPDREVSCAEAVLITIAFVHQQKAEFHPGGSPSSLNVEGWACSKAAYTNGFPCQEGGSDLGFSTYTQYLH
jgi:Peptidase A4 family